MLAWQPGLFLAGPAPLSTSPTSSLVELGSGVFGVVAVCSVVDARLLTGQVETSPVTAVSKDSLVLVLEICKGGAPLRGDPFTRAAAAAQQSAGYAPMTAAPGVQQQHCECFRLRSHSAKGHSHTLIALDAALRLASRYVPGNRQLRRALEAVRSRWWFHGRGQHSCVM
jgi:hypothetical protein